MTPVLAQVGLWYGSASWDSNQMGVWESNTARAGARWTGLVVPQGATITSATLTLALDAEATDRTVGVLAADDVSALVAGMQDHPLLGTVDYGAGAGTRTVDLTAQVQALVNRPGWVSGNAIAIRLQGDGDGPVMVTEHPVLTVTVQAVVDPEPSVTRITLERSVDGGLTWEVLLETPEASAFTDWESPSHGDVLYRATARTEDGATSEAIVAVRPQSPAVWVSGGVGYEVTARLPFDPSVEIVAGRQRAMKLYAGRSLPVAYVGAALSRVVSVSGTTLESEASSAPVAKLARIAQQDGALLLYRDPDGNRIYGVATEVRMRRQSVDLSDGSAIWAYSITLTEAT